MRGDRRPERHPVSIAKCLGGFAHEWELQVGVRICRAVTREVFRGGVHTGRVNARNRRGHVLRDGLGILSVAPLAHEWMNAVPDVSYGRKVDVKTQRLEALRHRAHFVLNGAGALRTGLASAGQAGNARLEEADGASFLVSRPQEWM